MKVGALFFFQDMAECATKEGFLGPRDGVAEQMTDSERVKSELRMAQLVEQVGFDSFWTVEHHFGPYAMTANPLEIFSYLAGATERIDLGTAVLVLPWHEPLRLVEEISLLSTFLGDDRDLLLGVGRGAAAREFNRFGVPYSEARERMEEILEILRLGLTTDSFSYSGKHFEIPETTIRPRPPRDLTPNILGAWSSTETLDWCAGEGLGQLFSNFSSLESVADGSKRFNSIREEKGWPATRPLVAIPAYCGDEGERIKKESALSFHCAVWHYDLLNSPGFKKKLDEFPDTDEGREARAAFIDSVPTDMAENGGGVYGTPDEVIAHLKRLHEVTGNSQLLLAFKHGYMTEKEAEASVRLFAEEVLPALHEIDADENFHATPYGQVVASRETAQAPA